MLESTVELLGGLFVSSLLLLIGVCIVGSTVVALRAVSRRSAAVSRRREQSRVAHRRPKDWSGLGNAALAAKGPDVLLKIPQALNQGPECEEQVRCDFREAMRTTILK
jgi:hypothetical protein